MWGFIYKQPPCLFCFLVTYDIFSTPWHPYLLRSLCYFHLETYQCGMFRFSLLYSLLKAQSLLFLPHGWYSRKQTRWYLEHFEICLHLFLAEKYLNRKLTILYKFHANVKWILIYSQILEDKIPIVLFELWVQRKKSWDVNWYGIIIMKTFFVLSRNRNTKFRNTSSSWRHLWLVHKLLVIYIGNNLGHCSYLFWYF